MLKTNNKKQIKVEYAPGGTHPLFLHPFLSFFTPVLRGKVVLDVGCGRGLNGSIIRATRDWRGATIIGLDINKGCLEFCRYFNIYDKLVRADLPKLPFKDKSIDFLICTEVIEHLEKQDGITLLKEIDRVCKGRSIVSTPNLFFDTMPGKEEDKHKSVWSTRDFKTNGYKVYGLGLRTPLLLSDKFLRLKQALYYFFTPISYFVSQVGGALICIKNYDKI
ncbi:MAG: class I SAM-dependent methyltransferase [bacterium]|nr:class I SAM-dependent methyltransferase [bacterium]